MKLQLTYPAMLGIIAICFSLPKLNAQATQDIGWPRQIKKNGSRNVYLRDIQTPDLRFPQLSADSVKLMGELFRELVPTDGEPISLDRLTADISEHQRQQQGVPLKNDPPQIFYRSSPEKRNCNL